MALNTRGGGSEHTVGSVVAHQRVNAAVHQMKIHRVEKKSKSKPFLLRVGAPFKKSGFFISVT